MCGIGGILRRAPGSPTDPVGNLLLTSLLHRGPDDRGRYDSPDGLATLVHTRLSILDLRREGRQPMARGSSWLSFNGEIYNFERLRQELIREGESFTTATDTEVILALYTYAAALTSGAICEGCTLLPFGMKRKNPVFFCGILTGSSRSITASRRRAIFFSPPK